MSILRLPPKRKGAIQPGLDTEDFARSRAATGYSMAPQSVQTTLTEPTALSIANELKHFTRKFIPCSAVEEALVMTILLSGIQTALRTFYPNPKFVPTDEAGLPADWIERRWDSPVCISHS